MKRGFGVGFATLALMGRMLRRDARAGELNILGLALVLAVAALTSVAFLADRVSQALVQQSHELLGGDLLLTADHPWAPAVVGQALGARLSLARSASFPSMVSSKGRSQLADIKAVSDGYPRRGVLRIADGPGQPDRQIARVPVPGSVWVDGRLLSALALRVGDVLRVGRRELHIAALLTLEPERGLNAFALGPRVLMHEDDLPTTGLILPGSRIAWRLHLAGAASAVDQFRRQIEPRLGRGERLESMETARPEVRQVLDRAQRFLRLAALLSVVLAAVAVGLAARRYMRRHLDGCAVLRCLGASSRQVLAIHGGAFICFGMGATLVGTLCGFAAQSLLHALLAGMLTPDLPLPGWRPWAQGGLVGLVLVVGFALPPLLPLRQVSTLRVLRREWTQGAPTGVAAWMAAALALAGLFFWVAEDVRLGLVVLAGFVLAFLLYGVAGGLLLAAFGRWRPAGLGWRYGMANLRRRFGASLIQMLALGLGLTTMLLLSVARGDLLAAWQARMPPDAPNHFALNIQPEQRNDVARIFQARGLMPPRLEPMVRGRLVAINGRGVGPADYTEERAQRLMEREFNLSWASVLPAGNGVVAGRWHGASAAPGFSVEQGLAETLGLKLGDRLTYDVAGQAVTAPIASLRKLDWDSMRVNFFVIAPPGMLDDFPASFITSFYLPADQLGLVEDLIQALPNLTVVDVGAVVRQLQGTLDQVVRAVEAVFAFALLAGLVVLYAALQATTDERSQELAVLRTLGARRHQLRGVLAAEFLALGLASGGLAGAGATLIGQALARQVFHLPLAVNPWLLLMGMALGAAVVLSAGLWGSRAALTDSPLQVLRDAG